MVSVEETEAESEGVSHMVLNDVFVLISDEMEDDLSSNWTEPIKGSPPRVSLPKKSGTQFRKVGGFCFYFVLFYFLYFVSQPQVLVSDFSFLKKCNESYKDSHMLSRN